jgi:hypothetical protein
VFVCASVVLLVAAAVFMDNLSKYVRHYLDDRVTNKPGWREFCVVFSDASVPGEVGCQLCRPGPSTAACFERAWLLC